jgi:hypothetical protein
MPSLQKHLNFLFLIVKKTPQILPRAGSNLATGINKKHCVGTIALTNELINHRNGMIAAAVEHVYFKHGSRF